MLFELSRCGTAVPGKTLNRGVGADCETRVWRGAEAHG